jgi:hypothetical protein
MKPVQQFNFLIHFSIVHNICNSREREIHWIQMVKVHLSWQIIVWRGTQEGLLNPMPPTQTLAVLEMKIVRAVAHDQATR